MKKNQQIKVIEYVHTADGGLVRVDQLGPEQKQKLDCWIVKTWVNTLYQGRAEVYYPEDARHQSPVTSHQGTAGGR